MTVFYCYFDINHYYRPLLHQTTNMYQSFCCDHYAAVVWNAHIYFFIIISTCLLSEINAITYNMEAKITRHEIRIGNCVGC